MVTLTILDSLGSRKKNDTRWAGLGYGRPGYGSISPHSGFGHNHKTKQINEQTTKPKQPKPNQNKKKPTNNNKKTL